MIHWIPYDISDTTQRNHGIKLLKDYGLSRRLESDFIRKLNPNDKTCLLQVQKRVSSDR